MKVNDDIWLRDEDRWCKGKILKIDSVENVTECINLSNNEVVRVNGIKKDEQIFERNITKDDLDDIDDLSCLSFINEPSILNCIKKRFMNDQIYTTCGNVLLALNPYKEIYGLYDEMEERNHSHIFNTSQKAINDLKNRAKNQSILISGESGSGKTSSTKLIIDYIIAKCGSGREISDKIIIANRILEFFGNAKTSKNDNSSRFGKYIKLIFNEKNEIIASKIEKYLLEKTRISKQEKDESNFHVMYTVLPFEKFKILPGTFDNKSSIDIKKELKTFFNDDEIASIYKSLRVILYFGELTFIEDTDETVTIKNDDGFGGGDSRDYLLKLGKELSCAPSTIRDDLLFSRLNVNNETIIVKNNISKCSSIRDSLIRFIYSDLFDKILLRINEGLSSNLRGKEIGILDIYGFENMDLNNFEQFCINFANEKLHSYFIERVFEQQQAEYTQEGIDWSMVNFETNSSLIDMIEGKGGIISLLNDESRLPKGSDNRLLEGIRDLQGQKHSIDSNFVLQHFSGSVSYSTKGFIEKNVDLLLIDIEHYSSLFSWFNSSKENDDLLLKKKSTITQFKQSLSSLMMMLSDTNSQYIRCIKSNTEKEKNLFVDEEVMKQIQSFGIIEVIRISSLGYPNRIKIQDFMERFAILSHDLKDILQDFGCNNYQIGKTMLFLNECIMGELEKRRLLLISLKAIFIQSYHRFYYEKFKFKSLNLINDFMSSYHERMKIIKKKKRSSSIICYYILNYNIIRKSAIEHVTWDQCYNIFLNIKIPSLNDGLHEKIDEIILPSIIFIQMIKNPLLSEDDPLRIIELIKVHSPPSNESFLFWIKNTITIASHLLFLIEVNSSNCKMRYFRIIEALTRVLNNLLEDWYFFAINEIDLLLLSIFNNRELSDCLLPLSPIRKEGFSIVLFDFITNLLMFIKCYNIDSCITNQFIEGILSYISKKGIFLLKDRNNNSNNLCRWKVGVHLQHNILKIIELIGSFNIDFGKKSLIPQQILPLFECYKLLQIMKNRDVDGVDQFLSKFEHITKNDFYFILNNYISDSYEDGQPCSIYIIDNDFLLEDDNQKNENISFYIKLGSRSIEC